MGTINTFKDVTPGAIVTSKQGKNYVLLTDDAHNRFLVNDNGNYIRCSETGLTFGKNDMDIKNIRVFATLPPADAISEGLKMIFRPDRAATAPLTDVWTSEDPHVTAAKQKMVDLANEMLKMQGIIDKYTMGK